MQNTLKLSLLSGSILLLVAGAGCSFSADSVKVGNKELGQVSYNVGDVATSTGDAQNNQAYLSDTAVGSYDEKDTLIAKTTTFTAQDRIGIAGQVHNLKAGSKLQFVITDSKNKEYGSYSLGVPNDFTVTPFYYNYKSSDVQGFASGAYTFHVKIIGLDTKQIGTETTADFTVK